MKFSVSSQAACSQQRPRTPRHRALPSQLCTGRLPTCKCSEHKPVREEEERDSFLATDSHQARQ